MELIVVRLITTVQQALKSVMEINKTVCFSDSMTVLYWSKEEKYKPTLQINV